jgi:hypothetical protein
MEPLCPVGGRFLAEEFKFGKLGGPTAAMPEIWGAAIAA